MYFATHKILLDSTAFQALPRVLKNAVEESAVLHTRILADVFLSKGAGTDDLRLSLLFAGWSGDPRYAPLKQAIGRLRAEYGTASAPGTPCWVFNKMLAHPTSHRGDEYDYNQILTQLKPVMHEIIGLIETQRGLPFLRDFIRP